MTRLRKTTSICDSGSTADRMQQSRFSHGTSQIRKRSGTVCSKNVRIFIIAVQKILTIFQQKITVYLLMYSAYTTCSNKIDVPMMLLG